MKRLLLKIVGVILVVGALGMLGMFWGDAHSGMSPSYKAGVERDAKDSLALADKLKNENVPADKLDAAMNRATEKLEELNSIHDEEDRHHSYWTKFYAIIAAAVLLGLVAIYFGFRKPRATSSPV